MKIRIDGTCIYLTAIGEQDTDRVIAWRNKPFVRKWFLYREEFTREGHRKWLENVVGQGRAEQFIIWVREEQHPIGSVYLRDIDREAKRRSSGSLSARRNGWAAESERKRQSLYWIMGLRSWDFTK